MNGNTAVVTGKEGGSLSVSNKNWYRVKSFALVVHTVRLRALSKEDARKQAEAHLEVMTERRRGSGVAYNGNFDWMESAPAKVVSFAQGDTDGE